MITQVNSIKVDGNIVTYMNKDILPESTVLIGIQILNLKAVSMALADGREGDWMWDKGSDVSISKTCLCSRDLGDLGAHRRAGSKTAPSGAV